MCCGAVIHPLFLNRNIYENRKCRDLYSRYQREGKEISRKRWVDSFILGDVYVPGFGFSLFEAYPVLDKMMHSRWKQSILFKQIRKKYPVPMPETICNGSIQIR